MPVKKKSPVKKKPRSKIKVTKTPAVHIKPAVIHSSKPGPKGPTKYTPEIVDQICDYVRSGDHTIRDLCSYVGISHETYFKWKEDFTEFSDRLKKADEERLVTVKALARTGLTLILSGYEYDEVSTKYELRAVVGGRRGEKELIETERTVTRKRVPPVPSSIFFALKNLDKEHFQDIQNQVLNTGGVVYIGGDAQTASIQIDED